MSVDSVSASNAVNSVAPAPAQAKPENQPARSDQATSQSAAVPTPTRSAAALQEVTETAAQTAKEARGGDRQAQRLVQKAAAAASNNEILRQGTTPASTPAAVNPNGQVVGTIVNTKV